MINQQCTQKKEKKDKESIRTYFTVLKYISNASHVTLDIVFITYIL